MSRKRDRKKPPPAASGGAPAGASGRERASGPLVALTVLLVALAALRAALVIAPSMWGWSLNLMRFLAPPVGWGLWAIAALALIPPVARRLAPLWNAIGDAIVRRPVPIGALAIAVAVVLVWMWPDRVRFVGDFLLRQGTVEVAERPSTLFPQALPLDVLLHYTLPRWFSDAAWVDANGAARILGMIEAGALAALALAFARALSLAGGAAVVTASVVFFGGYLGMYTGFSKAFAEMVLLVAMVGVFGLRALRDGSGLLPLGIAVAAGVTLHRSALGLLPAAAFVWVAWLRGPGAGGAWKRPAALVALAIPLVGLLVMVPRIVAVVRRWDALHFAPSASGESGGVLAAAVSGARPVDLVNLVLMLSPLALAIPLLLPMAWKRWPKGAGRELGLLALLLLPFLAVMPFLHPAQGLFRDWDDFAATGAAISLLAAWTLGQVFRAQPRHALAVAATLAVAVPSAQWIAHSADVDRGFQRVRAFMLEPPARPARERGTTWDFLGIRNFRLERWDAASESFSHAAETSPSPRILQEWALAETMRLNYPRARDIYHRLEQKAPENPFTWLGLGTISLHLGDAAEARRAANRLLALQPGNPDAYKVLEEAARIEAAARGAPPGQAGTRR